MEQGDLFQSQKTMSRQCRNILTRLRRGPATNIDLNTICYRYGARIYELRQGGHQIDKTRLDRGVWEYRLAR
jgi:hypothetical protein